MIAQSTGNGIQTTKWKGECFHQRTRESRNVALGDVTYVIFWESSKTNRRISEFALMRINFFKKDSMMIPESYLFGMKIFKPITLILKNKEEMQNFNILLNAFSS